MILRLITVVIAFLLWIALGIAFIRWPQIMFRVRHFPFHPSGDGLTEGGEQSYIWIGRLIVGTGVLLLIIILLVGLSQSSG